MKLLINLVLYQVCWLACILGGANGMPLLGIAVVGLAAVYHLYSAPAPRPEFMLLVIAGVIGSAWDSMLVAAGWLVYPSGTLLAGTAPYWITALWVAFATTFNVSLRWFRPRLLLAAALGAVGGPLAFLAGERLGGVVFADHAAAITALALGWALLMPLMLVLAKRFDGFGEAHDAAPAVAGNGR
jgi:hypothetical protein